MVKESACQYRIPKRCEFDPWVGKIPWGRAWQPMPAFLFGESHGQRSLVGYSPQGRKESDTTEVTKHARTVFSQENSHSYVHIQTCYVVKHTHTQAVCLKKTEFQQQRWQWI